MRWLRAGSLALLMGAGLSSCTSRSGEADLDDPILAWVQDQPIHRSVVKQIAQDRGLDSQKALEAAADTLRLYIAYRDNPNAPQPSAGQERFLRTQKAVRLWLTEDFEAQHTANTVPASMLKEALERAAKGAEPFRPRLHGLCQIIVRPKSDGSKKDPRSIPGFEAQARETIAALRNAMQLAELDLKKGTNCTLFDSWANAFAPAPSPELAFKKEALVLDLSQDQWDQDFVAQVSPVQEPTLLEPFMTQFGLHLVYVARVFKAHLPAKADGSLSADVQRQREAYMRDWLVETWRKRALKELLENLAKTQVIRWQGAPPGTPSPSEP